VFGTAVFCFCFVVLVLNPKLLSGLDGNAAVLPELGQGRGGDSISGLIPSNLAVRGVTSTTG